MHLLFSLALALLLAAHTRTVSGTFQSIYWLDDGTRITRPTPPTGNWSAVVFDHRTGQYQRFPGTVDASGNLSIPGVPHGSYFLESESGTRFWNEFSASDLDLSQIASFRPD